MTNEKQAMATNYGELLKLLQTLTPSELHHPVTLSFEGGSVHAAELRLSRVGENSVSVIVEIETDEND